MGSRMHDIVWIAHPVLELVLASLLVRRKLHRQFPVFFAYIISQIINFAILFPIFKAGPTHYGAYFYAYWIGSVVSLAIGFKVIHEIFLDVFRPYHTLKDLGTVLFRWAGVVMLLVSVVVAFSNSFDQGLLIHAVTTLERSVRIVQLGLILFLLLFSRFLGVSRKQISFGISLGFGLFAGVDLMMYALNSGGLITQKIFNLIDLSTYIVSILI